MKVIVALLLITSSVFAGKTEDLLIIKFTKVYHQLSQDDPAHVGVALRLADLLSERARQASMEELAKNCIICNAGDKDRKLAAKYYTDVIPKIEPAKLPSVLSHLGHLYELLGQEKKAIALYNKIIKSNYPNDLKAEAYMSLAEVYFKKRKYAQANTYYKQALNIPNMSRKGLATYRSAWCYFHTGNTVLAKDMLEKMLKDPELLQRGSSGVSMQNDEDFHGEVAKDYAVFISKSTSGMEEIRKLYNLSPIKQALENTVYLAGELENQGQKVLAKEAWLFSLKKLKDPVEKVEAQLHLAQLSLEEGNKTEALKYTEKALLAWSGISVCKEKCKTSQKRLRKFILDWNRVEKNNFSPELEQVYAMFIEKFASGDMALWYAQNFEKQKRYKEARENLIIATELLQKEGQLPKGVKSIESLWIKQMELAELSKDKSLIAASLQLYIDKSTDKTKLDEVKYQQAYSYYQDKNYETAATKFYNLVTNINIKNRKVKKQAADLALDSLVLLKSEDRIATWSSEFSTLLPSSSKEFKTILRKTRMNQVAKISSKKDANLEQAWVLLLQTPLETASAEENLIYQRNKLILAEKLNKFFEIERSAKAILEMKLASVQDKELALSRLAWLSEMKLDFTEAYKYTSKLKMASLKPQQKNLKLALLADLSGDKVNKHYRSFLKSAKVGDEAFIIARKILNNSSKPLTEAKAYRKFLLHKPEIFAKDLLEIYLNSKNDKIVKLITKDKVLKKTNVSKLFWRRDFITELSKQNKKLKSVDLTKVNEKNLSRTLVKKIKAIDRFEAYTNKIIKTGDWTAQLLCLDLLAKENMEFYNFLLSTPIPQGLSEEESQQYLTMLSQKATPYMMKSEQYRLKVDEFWKNEKAFVSLEKQYSTANTKLRTILNEELDALVAIAPSETKLRLDTIKAQLVPKINLPNIHEIQLAKMAVKKNPNDVVAIDRLISIQKELGQDSMVEYLEIRRQKISGGSL